ncbi:hypothetical protein [Deinococcus hopiensis]|uniref:hypothetical protein n=1 Tax=Deinococcus hopiensis TaxID=309885 RepID=UPI00111C2F24|nr:hypothetical protein [Deinococcus hopiensis]
MPTTRTPPEGVPGFRDRLVGLFHVCAAGRRARRRGPPHRWRSGVPPAAVQLHERDRRAPQSHPGVAGLGLGLASSAAAVRGFQGLGRG